MTIGSERLYLTANQRDDGSLGEVFIHWGKHGTSGAGLVNTYAIALSVGLAHQVPLADLIGPGLDQFFPPHGHTDDPEIPRVRSAVDYIARRLAIDWLPDPDRAALGVHAQGRIGLVGREHRGRRLRMRPQRACRDDGGAGQPESVGLTEFRHAPEHQAAERGDAVDAGPFVLRGDRG